MKPSTISESQLSSVSEVSMREQGQRRLHLKPEKNGPGLARCTLTLTASMCLRLYNILKMRAFPMF